MRQTGYSNEELYACAKREYDYRKRVYPRLVLAGKMTAITAEEYYAMVQPELFSRT